MEIRARADALIGRDEELARLGALLDRVAVAGMGIVLEGEPGIGKTELWRAAVAAAHERGYRVLEARPAEAESSLSFAALADLLALADEEIGGLPQPQCRPLRIALLLEEPDGAPPDPRAIAVGVLAVLRALAKQQPLVIAIDDVQWLDPASAPA